MKIDCLQCDLCKKQSNNSFPAGWIIEAYIHPHPMTHHSKRIDVCDECYKVLKSSYDTGP